MRNPSLYHVSRASNVSLSGVGLTLGATSVELTSN